MNWFQKLLASLPLIPGVVAAVENMKADAKDGATKKQLALESLGLGGAIAESLAPGDAQAIATVTTLVGNTIDGVVDAFNQHGWPNKEAPATATPSASAK